MKVRKRLDDIVYHGNKNLESSFLFSPTVAHNDLPLFILFLFLSSLFSISPAKIRHSLSLSLSLSPVALAERGFKDVSPGCRELGSSSNGGRERERERDRATLRWDLAPHSSLHVYDRINYGKRSCEQEKKGTESRRWGRCDIYLRILGYIFLFRFSPSKRKRQG